MNRQELISALNVASAAKASAKDKVLALKAAMSGARLAKPNDSRMPYDADECSRNMDLLLNGADRGKVETYCAAWIEHLEAQQVEISRLFDIVTAYLVSKEIDQSHEIDQSSEQQLRFIIGEIHSLRGRINNIIRQSTI